MTGLLAEGNIRVYEIALVVLNVGNVVLSYVALKYGYAPESVYVVSIVTEVGIIAARVWLSGKAYLLPVRKYCVEVLGNALLVAAVAGAFAWWVHLPIVHALGRFVTLILLTLVFTSLTVYVLGLTRNERIFFQTVVKKRLHINIS